MPPVWCLSPPPIFFFLGPPAPFLLYQNPPLPRSCSSSSTCHLQRHSQTSLDSYPPPLLPHFF